MGKVKIVAKSYLLGNTAPVLIIFLVTVSAVILLGDFSFLVSYGTENFLNRFITFTNEELKIVKIIASVLGTVLFALVIPALKFGYERWFYLKGAGKKTKVKEIFYYFHMSVFLRSQTAFWYSFFIKAGIFFFFQFPALCIGGVFLNAFTQGESASLILFVLFLGTVFLSLTGLIFYYIYSTNWFMYNYIVIADENIKLSSAYKFSEKFVKHSRRKVCLFKLSFIFWWLLCIFAFPTFYVWGYYKQSMAVLAFRNEYLK